MFDLSNVVETGAPIPNGTYPVVIEKAQLKDTKTGGEMISVQLKITGEVMPGRNIFDQFNVKNANPTATQIGLGQLKGMMKAFGHPNPNRLESVNELIGLKGTVTTKIEDSTGYGEQVRIKAYKPLIVFGATPTAAGAPIAPAASAAVAADPFK